MKAKDLLSLVRESSKGTKHVDGELKTPSYDNLNTPDNHVQGKGTKEVKNAKRDFGKKRDKKNPANPGTPRKKEKGREMGGPPKSYKRMNESLLGQVRAYKGKEGLLTITADPRRMSDEVRSRLKQAGNLPSGPVALTIKADPRELMRLVSQLRSQNVRQAQAAYDALVTHRDAKPAEPAKRQSGRQEPNVGKPMTAKTWMDRGMELEPKAGGQGTRAVFNSEPDEDEDPGWAAVGELGDPDDDVVDDETDLMKAAKERKGIWKHEQYESYADTDSMAWKQNVKKGGPVSKTAKVRGKVDDEPTNKADPGKPKNDGKGQMGDGANLGQIMNPKKVAQVHEGIKGLEKLLGRKLKISLSEESEEELRKQLRKARQREDTDEIKRIKAKLGLDQPDYGGKVSASSAASEVGRQRESFNRGSGRKVREATDPDKLFVVYHLRETPRKPRMMTFDQGSRRFSHHTWVDIITGQHRTVSARPAKPEEIAAWEQNSGHSLSPRPTKVQEGMDPVLYQYLRTALWSSNDESTPEGGDSMDQNYDVDDIAPEAVQLAQQMILKFQKAAGKLLDGLDMTRVAHDLWLTQNGHGAGFWDGDYEDPPGLGDKLTEIAKQLGEVTPYVGDDGVIYFYHG